MTLAAHLLPPRGPERLLTVATLVNTVGNGMFLTASALFFTRSVGLSPSQTGLGLTAGGLAGLVTGVPLDAVTFVLCALVVLRLPHAAPVPAPADGRRWTALRDRPYLVLTGLNGVLAFQYRVLTFAIPLWVAARTAAPRWLVAGLLLVNTGMVALFQVRFARGTEQVPVAARAMRRAGLVLLGSCTLVAAAAGLPTWAAVTVLVAGVAVHTLGELWQAAGSFGLSFELAPDHAQGQYQAVFGFGMGGADAFAPAVLSLLCLSWGRPGWLLTGALFALAGALVPAAARWAGRTRETVPDSPRPVPATP